MPEHRHDFRRPRSGDGLPIHNDPVCMDCGIHPETTEQATAALLGEIDRLRVAINGFRWVGNNLHNACTDAFADYFRAALEDARKAMDDEWQPMVLPRRADRRV